MPILPTYTPYIKQLFLPSTAKQADGSDTPQEDQAWVKIDLSAPRVEDSLAYSDLDPNSMVRMARWLVKRIVEWNFTEADGSPVPVTFETIMRLPKADFEYLCDQKIQKPQTSGLTDAEKKT